MRHNLFYHLANRPASICTFAAYCLIAALLVMITGTANAQIADSCSDVLASSARNFSQTTTDFAVAYGVYNNYCRADQSKSGASGSLGLSSVLDDLPLKFSASGNSTSERLSNFCKTFNSAYQENRQYYQNLSTVVDATSRVWLQCKTLATQGVGFSTNITQDQLLVSIKRLLAPPVSVQGITYNDSLMDCTAPSSDQSTTRVIVDQKTVKSLDENYWTITCVRKGRMEGDVINFPAASISVGTTAGPFLFTAPADASFQYQFASDTQKALNELATRQATLATDYATFKGQVLALPKPATADTVNFGGYVNGMTHNLACPPGQFVTSVNVVAGGTCHRQCDPDGRPLRSITISCSPKIGP